MFVKCDYVNSVRNNCQSFSPLGRSSWEADWDPPPRTCSRSPTGTPCSPGRCWGPCQQLLVHVSFSLASIHVSTCSLVCLSRPGSSCRVAAASALGHSLFLTWCSERIILFPFLGVWGVGSSDCPHFLPTRIISPLFFVTYYVGITAYGSAF